MYPFQFIPKMSVLVISVAFSLSGCAKESHPEVAIAFSSYTAQNPIMALLLPSAHAAVTSGKLCFKRLRFKMAHESTSSDVSADEDNVDFSPGEITIDTSGTMLGVVAIPAGTYERVEFDLEKNCPGSSSGNSVSFTNNNGAFWTDQRVTIKFEGSFEASKSGQVLNLNAQSIVTALNTVMSLSDIKTVLESASVKGTF